MKLESLKNVDPKTFNYISYSIIAIISVISVLSILSRFNNWPTDIFVPLYVVNKETQKEVPIQKSANQIREENYTYEESLDAYEGLRIQIANCVAEPFSVVYKNNTRIHLDGRSPDPQKITIGNQSVILDSYSSGYMTVRANELPATLSVDCQYLGQDHFNIATITLQQ